MKKTLGDYLIETYGENAIDLYWSEKNTLSPYDYTYRSGQRVWFKCIEKDYHEDYYTKVYIFTNKHGCPYCSSNKVHPKDSFGQMLIDMYGDNALDLYWSEKNEVDPFSLSKSCTKKVYIKCINKDYHEDYFLRCVEFTSHKSRCPYCRGLKLNPKDSFAQWGIDNVCEDFLERYWSKNNTLNPYKISFRSSTKVKILCQENEYHKDYNIATYDFYNGVRCGYCSGMKTNKYDSIGYLYPESIDLFSDKNKKTAYDYRPGSSIKVYWKCENGIHEDYKRSSCRAVQLNFRCPQCSASRTESMLQEKTRLFIGNLGYNLKHESQCSIVPKNPKNNMILPFDNEIPELRLIIEVHGERHYKNNGLNTMLAKRKETSGDAELHKRKLYDRYKRLIAHINKYEYLEIPYWEFDDDTYKQTILDKIESIRIKGE